MQTGQGVILIGGRPHDINLSWSKFCAMKKQETECDLSVQYRVGVHGDGKRDIRVDLDLIFIDRDWFFPQYNTRVIKPWINILILS